MNIRTNVQVSSVSGYHLPGMSDEDVKVIDFANGTIYYLPTGIGNFFQNLNTLSVGDEDFTALRSIRIYKFDRITL